METIILPIDDESIKLAKEILLNGGVVGMPTETVYGLAGVGTNPNAVEKICQMEIDEANAIFNANKIGMTDKIMRSKGILTNAYVLSTQEFFERFAEVKLGILLGLIKCKDVGRFDDFLVGVLPANLMLNRGSAMNETERDLWRASYTRENLNKILN